MYRNRFLRTFVVAAGIGLLLGGCSVVPASGPANYNIDAASSPNVPYALVKLTPETITKIAQYEPRGLAGIFPDKGVPPSRIKFGIGDVVSVTIFEAAAGGLFIPTEAGVRPGNFVQ